jgi:hypothetical protein
MKLIYHVKFKAKKKDQVNEFTIVAEVASLNKDQALIDAHNHVKRNYQGVLNLKVEDIQFVETLQSRITKLEKYRYD